MLFHFDLHAVVAPRFFAEFFLHHLLELNFGLGFSSYFGGVKVSCLGNIRLLGFINAEFELTPTRRLKTEIDQLLVPKLSCISRRRKFKCLQVDRRLLAIAEGRVLTLQTHVHLKIAVLRVASVFTVVQLKNQR